MWQIGHGMEGWQKVTFRLVKPYVLRCETYGLGLQKVWFCLWRVFDAFSRSFPLLFLSAFVGVLWCVWWWLVGMVSEDGKSGLWWCEKVVGLWKFKGSQSFGGRVQGGETPFI